MDRNSRPKPYSRPKVAARNFEYHPSDAEDEESPLHRPTPPIRGAQKRLVDIGTIGKQCFLWYKVD